MEPKRFKLRCTYRMSALVEVDAYSLDEARQSVLHGSGQQIGEPVKTETVELVGVNEPESEALFSD